MDINYILGILLFLIAFGYWLFYKKFFTELGKQTAEISTLGRRTKLSKI